MSAGTKAAEKSGKKTPEIPPLTIAEYLNAQRRKLLRATLVLEDAGRGKDSDLVATRPGGEIDQAKLASVLGDVTTLLREVMKALDAVIAEQKACSGQAAP